MVFRFFFNSTIDLNFYIKYTGLIKYFFSSFIWTFDSFKFELKLKL